MKWLLTLIVSLIFLSQPECKSQEWTVTCDEKKQSELLPILGQPFFYLGQGKQVTAFVSADGMYVLKFLRKKPLEVKKEYRNLPDIFPYVLFKRQNAEERHLRKEALYSSMLLSYQVLPEETGTVFVHITPTKALHKRVHLLDKAQMPHVVDLDKVQWVLQRRAKLIKPELATLMWQGRVHEAKRRIDQIFALLSACAKMGVIDVDPNLVRNDNIGFLENTAMYIDTGKLRLSPTQASLELDLQRLSSLHKWLKASFPELAGYFVQKKGEVLATQRVRQVSDK